MQESRRLRYQGEGRYEKGRERVSVAVTFVAPVYPAYVTAQGIDLASRIGIENVLRNLNAWMQTNKVIPRYVGALGQSINAGIEVTSATQGRIGSNLRYAAVMERGRAPGQKAPPIEALVPWVRRKLRPKPEKLMRGRTKLQRAADKRRRMISRQDRAIRSVAFLVARKIGEKGIQIPLVADGRGGMFRRSDEANKQNYGGWFMTGFTAAGKKIA